MTAIVILLLVKTSLANPSGDWEQGREAFRRGDYAAAVAAFESARIGGLDSAAIHYNIAVCYFKLGDFGQAKAEFRRVAERYPRMRGLAEYNLGLAAKRTGDTEAAREHFLSAYEHSPDDEKIRILASNQLEETEPPPTFERWSGGAGFRVGNDDNVALRDELDPDADTLLESPFADVFVSVRGRFGAEGRIRLEGSGYLVKYFDADEFDQSEIRGRFGYNFDYGGWNLDTGIHVSTGTFGGDSLDNRVGVDLRARHTVNREGSIDLRYRFDQIDEADDAFAGIAGSRHQIDARYRWRRAKHNVTGRLWFELNDRDDPRVSPTRQRVGIEYQYALRSDLFLESGIDYRNSDYDDLPVTRDERLTTIRAGATYLVRSNWALLFDVRHSDNNSSDPAFSYDRLQITLGAFTTF